MGKGQKVGKAWEAGELRGGSEAGGDWEPQTGSGVSAHQGRCEANTEKAIENHECGGGLDPCSRRGCQHQSETRERKQEEDCEPVSAASKKGDLGGGYTDRRK